MNGLGMDDDYVNADKPQFDTQALAPPPVMADPSNIGPT